MVLEVVALGVALGSLGVSIYAARIAKSAPFRDQLRHVREELRGAAVRTSRVIEGLKKQLDSGEVIPAPYGSLHAESEILKEHKDRFSSLERGRIKIASAAIDKLRDAWLSAFQNQQRLAELNEELEGLNLPTSWLWDLPEEEKDKVHKELKPKIQDASRQFDDSCQHLHNLMGNARDALERYLTELNEMDRRKAR